jgi:hypothetical protein
LVATSFIFYVVLHNPTWPCYISKAILYSSNLLLCDNFRFFLAKS